MGCDPKHDSVVTHFGGALIPTVLGTWAKFEPEGRADELAPEDVMFKGNGVYCMELGGPESARGCGGRGITFGFQMLEKWGLSEWNFHYMLLDFFGDVVCGGFGTPIARSMADKLIIVCSNEGQSMYAANNIASAARYFAEQRRPHALPGPLRQQGRRHGQGREMAEGSAFRSSPPAAVAARRSARRRRSAPADRDGGRQRDRGDRRPSKRSSPIRSTSSNS